MNKGGSVRAQSRWHWPLFLWSAIAVLAAGMALVMTSERAGAAAVPPTRLGINLLSLAYWVETRSFTNLALYGDLVTIAPNGKRGPIDPSMLGVSGWPANMPAGEKAFLRLLVPPGIQRGETIRCTWQGQATMTR